MKQILLFSIICALAGCASDGDKSQWTEFWKDARGDNMQMRMDRSSMSDDLPKPTMSIN